MCLCITLCVGVWLQIQQIQYNYMHRVDVNIALMKKTERVSGEDRLLFEVHPFKRQRVVFHEKSLNGRRTVG